jgi:hypothetical protein
MNKVKESLFAYGLLSLYNFTKSIAVTDKSLRIFSVLCKCCRKTVTSQMELKNYDAIHIKHYEWMCLYSFLGYPAGKSHPFCAILYFHLLFVWLYHNFSHYLIHGTIFGEKNIIEYKMNVFWFSLQLLSETVHILRKTEWDMIKTYISLQVKYPLFLSDFNEIWIFSTDILKILRCQISWKSVVKFHEHPFSNSMKTRRQISWKSVVKFHENPSSKFMNIRSRI